MFLFPGWILFFTLPAALYLGSQKDFGFDLGVLAPFLLALAGWAVIGFGVAIFPVREGLCVAALWLGFFLVLRDVVSPVSSRGLIGLDREVVFSSSTTRSIAEWVLLLGTILLALRVPRRFARAVLAPSACALMLFDLAQASVRLERGPRTAPNPASPAAGEREPESRAGPRRGNVYLICLDSFIGSALADVIATPVLADAFRGFVHYPSNISNYDFTWPSLASTMTGTLHDAESMGSWYDAAMTKGGLMKALAASGYDIWSYSFVRHESVAPSRFVEHGVESSILSRRVLLATVWLVRIAPTALRAETWRSATSYTEDSFFVSYSGLVAGGLELLERLADDERVRPSRNQFVFVHAYIPHGPFYLDGECDPLGREGDFRGQAQCSLRPVARLVETLKSRGNFSDSTIIVFSDHATFGPGTNEYQRKLLKGASRGALGAGSDRRFLLLANSLLLVKPPGSSDEAPLRVSTRQTQNLDIAATVASVTETSLPIRAGASVVAEEFPERRTIDSYANFGPAIYKKIKSNPRGARIRGSLRHYRFDTERGWRKMPDEACVW